VSRKTFYTERDIESLAAQGVMSLPVGEDIVYTELALEKARSMGIAFERAETPATTPAAEKLAAQVKAAVLAKLGEGVSESVIDAAIAGTMAKFNG